LWSNARVYDDLGPVWRLAVELAWESFRAGSIGVGAVVTDETGAVVASGRNRVADDDGPRGHLFGSRLAHAEIDALAALRSARPSGLTVWTTLEPCLLCASAMVLAQVARVRFAADDPLWHGTERLPELNDWVAARWPERNGPEHGPVAVFGGLLPLAWVVREFGADTAAPQAYAVHDPWLLARAHEVVASGQLAALAGWAGAAEAFDRLAAPSR
jgi:tRNA(adenine34) deaminase